ncbi:MAG: PAS domain-containing protein [Rhizobiaceae bacterium]|nr:PAS domain-containing protein [Rhizobiaceae bacterium]MCV0408528.1 PAS domain-containing protein [Rhizobiaceae bacterium]
MTIDFARLFDALPTPYMVIDPQYRFVTANKAYEKATLRTLDELRGRSLFELFPNEGESGRRLRESFDRVFETGKPDTLAYIPYDIPNPDKGKGATEKRYWTATHSPLADGEGAVRWLIQNTVDVTEFVRLHEVASLPFVPLSGEAQLLERAREAEAQRQSLLAESEEFRRLFQQAPGFFAVMSGPDHIFAFANDAYSRLVGGRDLIGLPVREALPEIEGQGFFEMLDEVYRTGEPKAGEAVRLMLRRAPGEAPRETFIDFSYDAIRNRDGAISGVFVQGMDRTENIRSQMRQKLLLAELNHRVKNTLASVQSIASQTLRNASDTETARRAFEARIIALSRAHNLLSDREWASASLADIMELEFSAYDRGRVEISGPDVTLSPKASIAVALLVHELATNASKYGALSTEEGTIHLDWRRAEGGEGQYRFTWREKGGPPVEAPQRRGFGSRMIDAVVAGELGGRIERQWEPDGFRASIDIAPKAFEATAHDFAY